MLTRLIIIVSVLFLTSCWEQNSTEANDSYRLWAGSSPPNDVEIINGQYWGSAHWSHEYILYLELIPSNLWWDQFVVQNNLIIDTLDWHKSNDKPKWFKPDNTYVRYRSSKSFDQGSRYFRDPATGRCFIYELQL